MRVLVSDPYLDPAVLADLGQLASLETVLAEADFVSLHVPVTQETRGLLDADRLALLKPTAYLINTARAAVIDEDALFDALASKRLAGAALAHAHSRPRGLPEGGGGVVAFPDGLSYLPHGNVLAPAQDRLVRDVPVGVRGEGAQGVEGPGEGQVMPALPAEARDPRRVICPVTTRWSARFTEASKLPISVTLPPLPTHPRAVSNAAALPTASNTISAPLPSVWLLISSSTPGPPAKTVKSAPIWRAISSLSLSTSTANTVPQPDTRRAWITSSPIIPEPTTTAVAFNNLGVRSTA